MTHYHPKDFEHLDEVEKKKYSIIYADPPWQFSNKKTGGSMKSGAAHQYLTTGIEGLKGMDIDSITNDNAVLFMWYVGAMPQEAIDLVHVGIRRLAGVDRTVRWIARSDADWHVASERGKREVIDNAAGELDPYDGFGRIHRFEVRRVGKNGGYVAIDRTQDVVRRIVCCGGSLRKSEAVDIEEVD